MLWPTSRGFLLTVVASLLVSFAFSPVVVAQATDPPAPDEEILCVVNDSSITRADVNKAVQQQWGREILADIIKQRLIFQAAKAYGLSITDEEVSARLAEVKDEYESLEEFNQMMESRGIKGPAFRRRLRARMLLEKLVKEIGAVSNDEAESYYEKHRSEYQSPPQVHLHAIVTAEAEQAYHARKQVANGAGFDRVAEEQDDQLGGDWGWLSRPDLRNPLIGETAFSLQAGDVSNPIYVAEKYYVLWVEETWAGVDRSFAEVKGEIADQVRQDRGITAESVLAGLWRKAEITVPWKAYYYLEDEYGQLDVVAVTVDGSPVDMPIAPMILESGHMLVMAKPLLQAINAKISWDAKAQMMSAVTEDGTVQVTVGSPEARSGDRVTLMEEVPQLHQGKLFISPRPVITALGAEVEWNPVTYTLNVTSPGQAREAE